MLRGTMLVVRARWRSSRPPRRAPRASRASGPAPRRASRRHTATLNGRVDPNDAETTYFFRYGTTSLYGTNTPALSAGSGANAVAVSVPVAGLAPATTYHYQLVAQNRFGITRGEHRIVQDEGAAARRDAGGGPGADSSPGRVEQALTGQLTGTNNAGRDVVLQSNPFPYLQGFANTGNALVTDAAGNFSFPVLSVPVTTQFRVVMAQRPEVTSPIVVVGAALQVRTEAKKVAPPPPQRLGALPREDLAAERRRAREHPEAARRHLGGDRAHGARRMRARRLALPQARAASFARASSASWRRSRASTSAAPAAAISIRVRR